MFKWFKRRAGAPPGGQVGVPGRLTGVFDLRDPGLDAAALVGYVETVQGLNNAGTSVEVWRQHVLIASAPAGPDNGHGRMPFTLPFDGRFTVSELVRESVRVSARNAQGDTGALTLDGATQLELVRDHFGVPVHTILDLDFTRTGNARPYLGAGWSGAEEQFTWTEGDDSLVTFDSPPAAGPHVLRLRAATFLSPLVTAQKLDIYVNEELIGSTLLDGKLAEFREFRFDGALFGREASSTLRLHHPYAARPSEHFGARDTRRLAFSFRRLSLARVLE